MKSMLLNGSDWILSGFWPSQRYFFAARELESSCPAPIPDLPATVPGAIHVDLLRAGLIPDWNNGLDAAKSEWVNNREWSLRRMVTVPHDFDGQLTLECDGLDYSGQVRVDGRKIADFAGTHPRHRFALNEYVNPRQTFQLEFFFHASPQLDGSFGCTSRNRIFKPRFGYSWDWCARVINIGIWQDVRLVSRGAAALADLRVLPRVDDDLDTGRLHIAGRVEGNASALRYRLCDERGVVVLNGKHPIDHETLDMTLEVGSVKLWWPVTHGYQPLYHLTLELLDHNGRVSDALERTVGFKHVRWLRNPGAPTDALAYLCEINGRPVFLRGANWVPLSPFYGAPTAQHYGAFLRLYRNMNANLLRVWGGGILERPAFYELCDRLGLLVWQELPLSSSAGESYPPDDPESTEEFLRIATDYVERRAHHACHLLWCGGNELQQRDVHDKLGIGHPIQPTHPLLWQVKRLIEQLDPGKRFLHTSPTGPRLCAYVEEFGKGLHHHVHGPWENKAFTERFTYWNGDDALLRTECGAPGCSSLSALERHRGDQSLWPPRFPNAHWLVPAAAWIPWNDVRRDFGDLPDEPGQLPVVVKASRYLQAESYRYAAESCRRRFPRCSGFVVWMGHDCMHCTANNSLIQIDASTKPAYDWLQRAFAGTHVTMKHETFSYPAGQPVAFEVWVCRDHLPSRNEGTLTARLRTLDGKIVEEWTGPGANNAVAVWPGVTPVEVPAEYGALWQRGPAAVPVAQISFTSPVCPERLFVIELQWLTNEVVATNRYLLSQQTEHALAPLLRLPDAVLSCDLEKAGEVSVHNPGPIAAVGVRLTSSVPGVALLTDAGHFILFPGESHVIRYETVAIDAHPPGRPSLARPPAPRVEWFNAP